MVIGHNVKSLMTDGAQMFLNLSYPNREVHQNRITDESWHGQYRFNIGRIGLSNSRDQSASSPAGAPVG